MSKLLNLNNYHYRRGGSDVVYLDHGDLFNQLGWQCAYFSMKHPKNISTKWNSYFVDEIEFGNDYGFLRKIRSAVNAIYSFESRANLSRLIQDFSPDIAHLHCIYHHLSPSVIPLLKKMGIPTVMTAHDLKIACPAYKMLNSSGICERCKDGSVINVVSHRCVRDSFAASVIVAFESGLQRYMNTYRNNLSKIVVPSRFFLNKFVEWGWPREQFSYIPNYVDSSKFSPSFIPGDYFLYFGRLAPEKGISTLIRAAAKAGVKLKIAGVGPQDHELRRLQFDLQSETEFIGYVSGDDLHKLIRESRAVVLPSEWYENAPMSVLEAFALGKPVIGARIGGIPELVVDDFTGWTYESKSVDDLADALCHANSISGSRFAEIGKQSLNYVVNNFNRKNYIESMLSLYSDLGVRG